MSEFELHFEEAGSGTPLLLIHGFPFHSGMWEQQLQGLSGSARLLAPDLPGFGESPFREGANSVESYAEDCLALLDALDILEPVVVGGLSMGGYVALAFARLFPERLAGLILASTRAGADSEEGQANRDKAIADVQAGGVEGLVTGMHPKLLAPASYDQQPEVAQRLKQIMLEASPEGVVASLQAMRDRPDSSERLADIEVPVLVIHGEEDHVIPFSEGADMAHALPAGDLVHIPGAGHLPNMENPSAFNQAVATFMAEL